MFEETPDELTEIDGIGPKNLFGLKLAQAVSMSYLKDRIQSKDFLTSSDEVLDYLKANLRERSKEVFMVLLLNGRNQILSIEELFEGTLTTSAVYPREVVRKVIEYGAAAVLFAHNHPSGNPNPSQDDITITKKLKEACSTIDVCVHDHIIIAGKDYTSLAGRGLI